PSERRAADLILAGKTNREIATELFITVHTVEKTLTRAYAKLDVRSRTELARRLADPEARPAERERHHARREPRKVSGFPAFGPEAGGRGWVSAGLPRPAHGRSDVPARDVHAANEHGRARRGGRPRSLLSSTDAARGNADLRPALVLRSGGRALVLPI